MWLNYLIAKKQRVQPIYFASLPWYCEQFGPTQSSADRWTLYQRLEEWSMERKRSQLNIHLSFYKHKTEKNILIIWWLVLIMPSVTPSVGYVTTDLNLCGLWTVKVGCPGVLVSRMRWGVRERPLAGLVQNVEVGLCVKVCPPHQHLNESTCISQTLETCEHKHRKQDDVLYLNFEHSSISNDNLCNTIYVTWEF